MAEELVSTARFAAGREYLHALADLGFDPEGALWSVRPNEPDTLELSIFSSVVDRIGAKSVFDVLFEAYDKSLTPKEFDPWDVGLYSPGTQFFHAVTTSSVEKGQVRRGLLRMGTTITYLGDEEKILGEREIVAERLIYGKWIYRLPVNKKPAAVEQMKSWRRFEHRIQVAA